MFLSLPLGLMTLLTCNQVEEKHEVPNIILIFMDDMGYGDLECYGHPLIKTPNLDKLAEGSIRYRNAFSSAPVCSATAQAAGTVTISGWTEPRS